MNHPASFIGVDGEGRTLADGSHIYTMLCASTGASVENEAGLTTWQCLDFLLGLHDEQPKAQIVGFSFNYDVNMILGDVYPRCLKELWETHETAFRHNGRKYHLKWIPSKLFHIFEFHGKHRRSARIWDVFGFFQMSFVKALKDWNIGGSDEVSSISRMKGQRSSFQQEESAAIKDYCFSECRLLVGLMDTLEEAFLEAGICLDSYHGAGAAASALLKQQHVKDDLVRLEETDPDVYQACLCAYFGGRTEIFRVGQLGTVYNNDLNSAYPAATVKLPSMKGTWKRVQRYDETAQYALWYVEWSLSESILAPFPFRLRNRIVYSRNGVGWYHSVEVAAALRHFGGQLTVKHGFVFEPDEPDRRPFVFVRAIYDERRRLKDAGSRAEKPLKLAINSIYGKLAQGYGYADGSVPPYQSYYWAGLITATTRARILDAVFDVRDKLIGIATDGIFTTIPLPQLPHSKALGEWDAKTYRHFFSAQPGVYSARLDGRTIKRNRGFSARELKMSRLRFAYRMRGMGAGVTYDVTRFVGYGAASAHRAWRTWSPQQRRLVVNAGAKVQYRDTDRLMLWEVEPGLASAPYRPKGSWLDFDGSELSLEEETDMDS